MKFNKIINVSDIARWRLCTGCGACKSFCSNNAVTLVNVIDDGIRPQVDTNLCKACGDCLSFCPGFSLSYSSKKCNSNNENKIFQKIGEALEVWEGYATDPEIRFKASSGGILSALSLFCLEKKHMKSVLHTGMDKNRPWLNKTYQSFNSNDVCAHFGSRYAPASPCDSLRKIEDSQEPCVFIGKPCDAAATFELCKQKPGLNQNIGIILTHFCAGTPSTQGTLNLLSSLDVPQNELKNLAYRGNGWPGGFHAVTGDQNNDRFIPYLEAWNKLYKYVPWRCRMCVDGLGQFADISCGDAWQDFNKDGNAGLSLILARSKRGKDIIEQATNAGYITVKKVSPEKVLEAQKNLILKRSHLFGRLLAMKLFLIPTPRYSGFRLYHEWNELSIAEKSQSIIGTLKRIIKRNYWRKSDSADLFLSSNIKD